MKNTIKTARRRILQVAGDLYLHAITDKHMQESLHRFQLRLSKNEIRRQYEYLGGVLSERKKSAVKLSRIEDHDIWSIRIAPFGIDILTGAVNVEGIRKADPNAENLPLKREIRRAIITQLNERPGDFIEDVDILEHFFERGFATLDLASVHYHLWYLAGKGYITMRQIRILATNNFTAKISSAGADLCDSIITDIGVSEQS